jgi:hypothetical protein
VLKIMGTALYSTEEKEAAISDLTAKVHASAIS